MTFWSAGVAVATGTIQNVMRRSRAHSALRVEHWRNGHGRPWRKQRQGQKRKTKKGSAESEREEEGEGREKEEQIGARWVGFPRSVPKLGRARSEKKSATCPAAGTSQVGRTLILRPRSGTAGLALSPQLGGRWRLQGFPCSSRRTPCSCSQGIGRYSRGKAREFRLCFQQESQISEKFSVFSLSIRDVASETSSPQTAPTAS